MKVRSGEKLEIRVERDAIEGENQAIRNSPIGEDAPAGIIPIESEPDYLPRRAPKKAGINFYDFGQIYDDASSSFKDLSFRVFRVTTNNPSPATDGGFLAAQWNALRDLIFAVSPNDWKTKYRKLDYEAAEKYGVDLTVGATNALRVKYPIARNGSRLDIFDAAITDSHWTDKGLIPVETDIPNFQVSSFSAFVDFTVGTLNGAKYFKVTAAPSYAAPEVTGFKLAKSASVFLVPYIVATESIHQTDIGGGSVIEKTLVNGYQPFSREFWLNRTIDSAAALVKFHPTEFALTGANATDWTNYIKTLAGALGVQKNTSGSGNVGSFGAGGFPASGYKSFLVGNVTSSAIVPLATSQLSPGCFVAAIQQNGQTFYVWEALTYAMTFSLARGFNKTWTFSVG